MILCWLDFIMKRIVTVIIRLSAVKFLFQKSSCVNLKSLQSAVDNVKMHDTVWVKKKIALMQSNSASPDTVLSKSWSRIRESIYQNALEQRFLIFFSYFTPYGR